MKTRIFDLPKDLVYKILSRVPLKSMRALRLTCKKWKTLSKSRRFTKMHLGQLAKGEESLMIALMDNNLYLTSGPSKKVLGKLTCLNEISKVFHYEGLFLFISSKEDNIVIWNPYWGQTRLIKQGDFHKRHLDKWEEYGWSTYALGYVNDKKKSCHRIHKILRCLEYHYYDDENIFGAEDHFLQYEIYDFEFDLWTTLDVDLQWHLSRYQLGVSLKGNTYWCTKKLNKVDDHIIYFDFTKERFGPLMHLPFSPGRNNYVTLSCVREEKLAVLHMHNEVNPYKLEIWITTKIEEEKILWSKFLTLSTGPNYLFPIWNFFIEEEKKVVMGFDEYGKVYSNHHTLSNIVGEDGYLRKLDLGEENCWRWSYLCFYIPSLVQIKQHARRGGKRKEKSNLEKLRCGEKMLKSEINRKTR